MKTVLIKYELPGAFGGRLAYVCHTPLERQRAETLFTKEAGTVAWLRESLRPNDTFIDVGANIGLYSIYAAALQPTALVYAIEPHLPNAHTLLQNIVRNGQQKQVRLLTCALGYRTGCPGFFTDFNYLDVGAGASGSQLGHVIAEDGRIFQPVLAEPKYTTTLDQLVADGVVGQPTLIKIDVDGNEAAIVEGMATCLADPRLRAVQVEVHPKTVPQVLNQMADRGFKGFTRHNTANGKAAIAAGADPESIPYNLIFSKERDHHA